MGRSGVGNPFVGGSPGNELLCPWACSIRMCGMECCLKCRPDIQLGGIHWWLWLIYWYGWSSGGVGIRHKIWRGMYILCVYILGFVVWSGNDGCGPVVGLGM